MNTLKQAVIEQLGYESENDQELIQVCEDISNYGIGGGYGGFIYYNETIKFFDDNRGAILRKAQELAECLGYDMLTMIKGFNCLNGDYSETEIMNAIYEADDENETQIKNALSWFAAEEIAREIADA